MKLMLDEQLFVKNNYTEFHENLTDSLVTDTRLWKHRGTSSPHKVFFFVLFCKEHLKSEQY
jgi:hypothetical protein